MVRSFLFSLMKDFREYWQAVAKGDWQGQDAFFAIVVQAWSFEGDPHEAEACCDLEFRDYHSIQLAIRDHTSNVTRSLSEKRLNKGIIK